MSDANGSTSAGCLTIPAGFLPSFRADVESLFSLQPPPPQPGKYYIAKAAQAAAAELPLYLQQKLDLLKKHAPRDKDGQPILKTVDQGNGQTAVSIDPVDQAAFNAEDRALGQTPINLTGVPRLLKASELGDCPIPQGAYTRLLGVLFEDTPPEGA